MTKERFFQSLDSFTNVSDDHIQSDEMIGWFFAL